MNPRSNADRVALYARVSGDRQEKQATIETQINMLRERVCAEGWTIHAEYLDNPYTGTTDSRPALDRLRDDARKGLFNRVLIYDPDRLARGKPWLRPYLEEQLARAGAPVTYRTYEVQDSPEGRVMDGMRTLFAEWEREKFVARTRDGKLNKVKGGHIWRGHAAFGYTYSKPEPGQKHGSLALLPEEAAIVRLVFDHVLAGRSLHWVAAELVRLGVPTRKGGAWDPTRIGNIIHNPLYRGVATYGRWAGKEVQRPRVKHTKQRRETNVERPREEWIVVPVPAIVSEDEQAQALALLEKNRLLSKRNTKQQYLLAGLVFCGTPHRETGEPCGLRFGGGCNYRRETPQPSYRCRRVYVVPGQHRRSNCTGVMYGPKLDRLVWERLVALLRHPDELQSQLEQAEHDAASTRQDAQAAVQHATAALGAAQTALDRLLDLHLAGTVDVETFTRKQAALVRERDGAAELLHETQHRAYEQSTTAARWADVRAYCGALRERLADLEQPEHFTERQQLVRTLVRRVTVYPDRVTIEGVLPWASAEVKKGLYVQQQEVVTSRAV